MKASCIIFFLLAASLAISARVGSSIGQSRQPHHHDEVDGEIARAHTLLIAGSRLPDCSHACGQCSPCRLVSVGSACAALNEAEACPISYRCMCKNKFYHVP